MFQDNEDYSTLKTPPGRGGDPKSLARYHARKRAGEYFDPFMFEGQATEWMTEPDAPESLTVEDALCLCGCVEGLPDLCENISATAKSAYDQFVHQSQQRAKRRVEDAEFDALPGPTPETVDQSQVDRSSAWYQPGVVTYYQCDYCDKVDRVKSEMVEHEKNCEKRTNFCDDVKKHYGWAPAFNK